MKVERMDNFEPVHIILETQEEVDVLFAVVNFKPIYEASKFIAELHEKLPNSAAYLNYRDKLGKRLEKWYKAGE